MDTDLYRTFLAINDTRSFTLAAQQVGRTQSAVSQQVKRLEDWLGRPLFSRAANQVELTRDGKSLIEFARSIVDAHSQAMAAFNHNSFAGIVVVGVADVYLRHVLRDLAVELVRLYPQATLKVVIDESPVLARRIADGSLDLAFCTEGNCPTSGPVVFRDRLVVAGPAVGDLHAADPLPIAVWDERNQDEGLLIAALRAMNRRYRVVFVCRSIYAQHAAITAGLCAAVQTESSLVPGERAYLEADGFPVLRDLTVRLERSPAKKSRVVDRLAQHYLQHFAAG